MYQNYRYVFTDFPAADFLMTAYTNADFHVAPRRCGPGLLLKKSKKNIFTVFFPYT